MRDCVRCHWPGLRALAAGATFTNRTMSAPWAGRRSHASVIDAAGAIYVIGGTDDVTPYVYFNDVWVSPDKGADPARVLRVVFELEGRSSGAMWGPIGHYRGTQGHSRGP